MHLIKSAGPVLLPIREPVMTIDILKIGTGSGSGGIFSIGSIGPFTLSKKGNDTRYKYNRNPDPQRADWVESKGLHWRLRCHTELCWE